jgi:hypothetical protein
VGGSAVQFWRSRFLWRGRPASYATIKNTHELVAERQSETEETLASDNQRDNFQPTAT